MVTKNQLSRIIDMHIHEHPLTAIARCLHLSIPTVKKYVRMFRDPRLCKLLPW